MSEGGDNWAQMLAAADVPTKPLLADASGSFENGVLTILYPATKSFLRVRAEERRDRIEQLAAQVYGGVVRVAFAEKDEDATLRDTVFGRITSEHARAVEGLLWLTGQSELLADNPLLKRSIEARFPYVDPLNHVQVELLRRHRQGELDERVARGVHLSINGIAAGLRNTG